MRCGRLWRERDWMIEDRSELPKIEVVREDDPDFAVFEDRAEEVSTPLEDCDELFARIDKIRRKPDSQD